MDLKVCSKCGEHKSRCSFYKDSKTKDGLRSSCKCCVNKISKLYHKQNRDQILRQKKEYYIKNRSRMRLHNKECYELNRSKRLEYAKNYREDNCQMVSLLKKQWYQKNREVLSVKKRYYYQQNRDKIINRAKKYRQDNKEKVASWRAKYRALRQEAVPKVLVNCPEESNRIEKTFKLRDLLTKATGTEHHVDHIWPLSKGGPHWSGNLQIITAEENLRKGDKICEETARVIQESLDEYCSSRQ